MKRSNITTLSLPWNQIGGTLPNLAHYIRLSLQKLRLEYKDKEEMSAIWNELGSKIGRRGSLQIDGLFEIGCGANPSTRIDAAQYPVEAAKLKELYAVPASMTQEAILKGWAEEQIVPKPLSEEYGFQYIITMNSDRIPYSEFSEGFEFDEHIITTRLSDKTSDGGLFGFRFGS